MAKVYFSLPSEKKEGRRIGEWIAKIVINRYAFMLDSQKSHTERHFRHADRYIQYPTSISNPHALNCLFLCPFKLSVCPKCLYMCFLAPCMSQSSSHCKERPFEMHRDILRCGDMFWDAETHFEMRRYVLRWGEIFWDAERCFEMRKHILRCGDMFWDGETHFEMRRYVLRCREMFWDGRTSLELQYFI